jgi:hypothetical protein
MSTFSTIISFIKASQPELNSESIAGIINKEAEDIGQIIDNTLSEFTNTKTIITETITSKNDGHAGSYIANALAYQEGDNLLVDSNGNYYYAIIDTTKQIIKQAAFKEIISGSNATLVLKVAYLDPDTGLLAKLPTDKKAAFDSYFRLFEKPGLPVTKISNDPNILAFNALITYNPTYDFTVLQTNITAALLTFRDNFTFNGIFRDYYLENYLVTNVPGVNAVYLSGTTIDAVSFAGDTVLNSGYFNYGTINLSYESI